MGAVMIRCPRTGRAVSTEIETEPSVFSRLPEVAGANALPGLRRGTHLQQRLAREPTLAAEGHADGSVACRARRRPRLRLPEVRNARTLVAGE